MATDFLISFDDLKAGSAAVKKLVQAFTRAGVPVASSDIDPKTRRTSGVNYRQVLITFTDNQKVLLGVKTTGDIFEVRVNGNALAVKNQDNQVKAIGEIAKALDAGRAKFQAKMARTKAALPKGITTSAPKMEQRLQEAETALDAEIAAAKAKVVELRAELGEPTMDSTHTAAGETFDGGEWDTLIGMKQAGKVEDGDVPSKGSRDSLVERGFVERGEGFNWLTDKGKEVAAALDAVGGLYVWHYDRATGYWDMERTVTPETTEQWLKVWRDDMPKDAFRVAKNRPSGRPKADDYRDGKVLDAAAPVLDAVSEHKKFFVAPLGKPVKYFADYDKANTFAGPDGKVFKNLGGGKGSLIRNGDDALDAADCSFIALDSVPYQGMKRTAFASAMTDDDGDQGKVKFCLCDGYVWEVRDIGAFKTTMKAESTGEAFKLLQASKQYRKVAALGVLDAVDVPLASFERPEVIEAQVIASRLAAGDILDDADLSHARATLENALDTVETNHPINVAEGNLEQAELEERAAESFRAALKMLESKEPLAA